MHLELDTETNGWNMGNRLAAISFALVHEWRTLFEFYALVQPVGWKMDPEATAKNGLTDAMLHALGVPISFVFQALGHVFTMAEPIVVAHQVTYDVDRVLLPELVRAMGAAADFSPHAEDVHRRLSQCPRYCTMVQMKDVCKIPNKYGKGIKMPNLGEAYKHATGRNLPNAHNAIADRRAVGEIFYYLQGGPSNRWHGMGQVEVFAADAAARESDQIPE